MTTDAEGGFTISDVPTAGEAGSVKWVLQLVDHDHDYPAFTTYGGNTSREPDAKKYAVAAGSTTTIDVEMVASATVEGKVVDEDGKPVAGASVSAWHLTRDGGERSETDAQGRYVIHGLGSGPSRSTRGSTPTAKSAPGTGPAKRT